MKKELEIEVVTINQQKTVIQKPLLWKSTIYCIFVASSCIGFGFGSGFTSTAKVLYMSSGIITLSQGSLFGSFLQIGAMAGCITAGGILMHNVGSRKSILIASVSLIIGWILHMIVGINPIKNKESRNFAILGTGRIIIGWCIGVISSCAPVYISQMSPPELINILGVSVQGFINLGIFISFLEAYILTNLDFNKCLSEISNGVSDIACTFSARFLYKLTTLYFPLIGACTEAFQFVLVLFCTDLTKPIQKKENDQSSNAFQNEENFILRKKNDGFLSKVKMLKKRDNLHKLFVGVGCMVLQQLVGISAVIFNASDILSKGIDKNDLRGPALNTVYIGIVMNFATFVSVFAGKYVNRKLNLIIGAIIMSINLLVLGLFYKLDWTYNGIAISMMVIYIFVFLCGWGPIPWIITGDIYPDDIKSIAGSISTLSNWFFAFLTTLIHDEIVKYFGVYSALWLYSGFCLLSVPFSYFFVPNN